MKKQIHLLLADDNPDEVFFITRALENAGYAKTLETASDGLQVIEKLSGLHAAADVALPDALILDLNMPRKTGYDVLEWMKEHQFHLPVIVHTSTDDPDEAARAIELGADAFVVKEVSYHPLIRKLSEMLPD